MDNNPTASQNHKANNPSVLQSILPIAAICHAHGADIPCKVVEDLGTASDGKHYVKFTSDLEGYAEGQAVIDQIEPIAPRDAAFWYAVAFGWPVIPLHTPTGKPDNPCSCNRRRCKNFGKHPCHDRKCGRSARWWVAETRGDDSRRRK